jgi:AcrR family transcriptional regulator
VKRTRKLILDAFKNLLAEKDFNSITVQDIAERADVNRATFYMHYEDKYALLAESVRESLREMLEQRLLPSETLTLTDLRLLAITFSEFMAQFSGACHPNTRNDQTPMALIISQVQQYVQEILLDWIKRSIQHKAIAPKVAPEIAASSLSWVFFGAAFSPAGGDRKQPPASVIVDQILAFLMPSLDAYFEDLGA